MAGATRSSARSAAGCPAPICKLRIVAALLFIAHGTQKLFGYPAPPSSGLPPMFSLFWIGAILEAAGGLLVLVGFYSRAIGFILAGEMAVAYFMFHAPRSFFPLLNNGDSAVLFCFVFLYIAVVGPGAFSINRR
jgi:putative oxidoreductase